MCTNTYGNTLLFQNLFFDNYITTSIITFSLKRYFIELKIYDKIEVQVRYIIVLLFLNWNNNYCCYEIYYELFYESDSSNIIIKWQE